MDWLIYAYIASALIGAGAAASAADSSRKQIHATQDIEKQRRLDAANLPAAIQKPFDFAKRGANTRGFPAPGVGFPGNTQQGSLGLPSNNMLGHTQLGQ